MENKKKRTGKFSYFDLDLFLLGLPVCFVILFLVDARNYSSTAAFFPHIVGVITLGLLFGALIQHYARLCQQSRHLPDVAEAEAATEGKGGIRWYANLAMIFIYFLLIYIAGFVWASLLYLLAAPMIMGFKKFRIVAVIAAFWIIVFIYVFHGILQARIPKGLLEQLIQKMISS